MKKSLFLIVACILSLGFVKGQDTLTVDSLKWERRVYEKDIYRIVVSGYNPRVDTVEIYIAPQVTTKYLIRVDDKKKKRGKRKDDK